jgi:diacylglycerol kinase (ATP)
MTDCKETRVRGHHAPLLRSGANGAWGPRTLLLTCDTGFVPLDLPPKPDEAFAKMGENMDWILGEIARIKNTFTWSWQGWFSAWAREKSLRQWSLVNLISILLAFMVEMTSSERALILSLGLLVLAADLANTAIEEAVDYIIEDRDERAKRAKDAGSAMVALTALAGGVAWLVILIG